MKTKTYSTIVFSFISLSLPFSLHANKGDCQVLFEMQNWHDAKKACLSEARAGSHDNEVYYALAKMSEQGLLEGTAPSQAMIWYKKAAEHGHVNAQMMLGERYRASGVDYDSYYWYKQAALQGNPKARKILAQYYLHGIGTDRNYPQAIRYLEESAYQGDLGSQLELAKIFENGQGAARHLPSALFWYEKAAHQGNQMAIEKTIQLSDALTMPDKSFHWRKQLADMGHPKGMFLTAQAYEDGYGVAANKSKAFYWYRQAARSDHYEAQWITATMYHDGVGTNKDMEKALYWYMRSADNEVAASQYQLALFHLDGFYVARDKNRAQDYMNRAAENGHPKAKVYIARQYINKMSISERNHAGILFKEAAEAGDADGQYEYGKMLYDGFVFEQDRDLAVYWLGEASAQDHVPATAKLAQIYYTDQDFYQKDLALKWLNRAAFLGDPESLYIMGNLYIEGDMVEKDWAKGFEYYQKSAAKGYVKAQGAVAKSYHEGLGTPQNYHLAAKWYEQAGFQGDLLSQYNLAVLYKKGRGVKRDIVRAYSWMSVAAASGFPEAMAAQKQWRKQLTVNELNHAQHMSAMLTDNTPTSLGK